MWSARCRHRSAARRTTSRLTATATTGRRSKECCCSCDRTSGKTTYGGGRVVDIAIAKGSPPQEITFDLNTAYSFLCAHSDAFNCPLVLTNNVDVALKYGEKYPPVFSGDSAKR